MVIFEPNSSLDYNKIIVFVFPEFNALVAELNRMPVSNDSYKIRQRSIQIEKELRELEGKIELYKTKRVFVKIPEPQ